MAITLDAIHQPLNDFFLSEFKTEDAAEVMFRFDKFGSVLSDEDFIDNSHPDVESPALAIEKFSDLVNRVPTDAGDGLNVVLSADSIDSAYYFRLLSPSMPFIPAAADDATKQSVASTFFALKREAMLTWENIKLESLGGLMLQYKPSTATPEDWFDRTKTEAWTSHSFKIAETTAPVPAAGATAPNVVWKMRLPDDAIVNLGLQPTPVPAPEPDPDPTVKVINFVPIDSFAVESPVETRAVSRAALFQPVANLTELVSLAQPVEAAAIEAAPAQIAVRNDLRAAVLADQLTVSDSAAVVLAPPERAALETTFVQQYRRLDVKERLWVNQYVDDNAPAEPAKATGISISFDYCLVKIRRPWFVDAFINLPSWWAPATPKGQITAAGKTGAVSLLPIAFVAIRDLQIEANWSAGDLAAASEAVSFGPFKVSPDVVAGKVSHPGLQIVGWLLQRMPPLPPQDAPA